MIFCFLFSLLDTFLSFYTTSFLVNMFFKVHLFYTISSASYLRQKKLEDFWTKINEFLWVNELKSGQGDNIVSIIYLAQS